MRYRSPTCQCACSSGRDCGLDAVEGVAGRQDAGPAGAAAGELDRRLDRFRTAVGEYDVGEARRRHREQSYGQLALGIRDRRDDEVRQLLPPGGLERPPDRFRMVAEWNRAELRDEIGVARSVRADEMASLAAHERLVEAQTLIEEALVGRDVPYIGVLLLRAPIPQRRELDHLVVEKGPAALARRAWRRAVVGRHRRCLVGDRRRRRCEAAALAQMLRQQRALLRRRELVEPPA